MNYDFITEQRDIARIDKLNKLTCIDTFWHDVKKLTARIKSDSAIRSWQGLAEMRYKELFYEPRKRTVLDGKEWWCVFDKTNNKWSTLLCHGKYKRKIDCELAIYNTVERV